MSPSAPMRSVRPESRQREGALLEKPGGAWLLALHSSSETLGVGLQRLGGAEPPQLAAFPLGRGLSGSLLPCVESVLPASGWRQLGRIAVAIGPGGFTGTRLTVTMARTLAQQLALPLDGVGSFALIARRLLRGGQVSGRAFWVVQALPRRGLVAALYAAAAPAAGEAGCSDDASFLELSPPRLYPGPTALSEAEAVLLPAGEEAPALRCPAAVHQPDDVAELLRCSQAAALAGQPAPWSPVLPLYPTSPVDAAR